MLKHGILRETTFPYPVPAPPGRTQVRTDHNVGQCLNRLALPVRQVSSLTLPESEARERVESDRCKPLLAALE